MLNCEKKISVIIPVYNTEQYLSACLKSVKDQTYSNLEILCIDDGSSDGSLSILERYSSEDKRFVIISQSNQGVSSARNAGLDRASGEYISFVDSDDQLEPEMYETLVGLLDDEQADIAHCGYKKIHLDGSEAYMHGTGTMLVQTSSEALYSLLAENYFSGSLWNKLYKADLFHNLRFDPKLKINEDILMNSYLFQRARKIVFLDACYYVYFDRMHSSCHRTDSKVKADDVMEAGRRIWEQLKGTDLFETASNRYLNSLLYGYSVYHHTGEQTKIHDLRNQMKQIYPFCSNLRNAVKIKLFLSLYCPALFSTANKINRLIKKPNWDL